MLAEESEFSGTFTGKLGWKNDIDEPLPKTVRIKSIDEPELWISIPVDSTGVFSGELPTGKHKLLPSTKITSPGEDYGFDNQFRVDDSFSQEFEIFAFQETTTEPFLIPTYAFPNYLMRQQGILKDYTEELKPEVDNFVRSACAYYNIPGASIALIKKNEIVYYNRFGVENALTQVPLGEKTVFQAASVTKAVFAFMILRLVEKKVLTLDEPLYNYLPFENIAHDPGYKKMTARHVLSHQTGLSNWAFGGPGGYASGQKTDLKFEPGTDYGYSGEGFEYLGRVVEKLTGKDLNQLLKEEVIEALNIPPLYFNDDGSLHQARGHYPNGTPTYFGPPTTPGVAHSMLTEAWSFAHFVRALSQKQGLPSRVYDALHQPIIKAGGFDSPENLYSNLSLSLGFFVRDTPFGKAIGHGGNNGDFQADFLLYTEKNMGYVVFVNDNTGHKLAHQLNK
ncbi:MAG: serine hydrolase domain-containing protein, partial [Calditrichota bacterium]